MSRRWKIINLNQFQSQIFFACALTYSPHFLFFSTMKPWLPQSHGSKAKAIKVYKYVNTAAEAHQEERCNDIFCPRLANPQDSSKLETLMTTNNAQMVKLWGHAGPTDVAPAPCGQSLHANTKKSILIDMQASTCILRSRFASMQNTDYMQRAYTHMHITSPDATLLPMGVITGVSRRSGLGRSSRTRLGSAPLCLYHMRVFV